jgi:copper ion binding protein
MTSKILKVEGMSCGHCTAAVTRAVSALKGVSSVEVDLVKKTVAVKYDDVLLPLNRIEEAIRGEGYRVVA